MIKKIFQNHEFENRPPVLVDVGASGGIHLAWKEIAQFSICVGFDADLRATNFIVDDKNENYKKLYILNELISGQDGIIHFYLTESPYCSSTLEPDLEALSPYSFSHLFKVKNKIDLPAVTLKTALASINIDYVDWFKTDSQGTDLAVFKGLGHELMSKVIVAEFEPGIMDAYKGEDKMHDIMAFMKDRNFWLCDLQLRGPLRISDNNLHQYFDKLVQEHIELVHKKMPFWGEMLYLSDMRNCQSKRDLLFGCACAIIHEQYGFCIEIAQRGINSYGDGIFEEIIQYAVKRVERDAALYVRKNTQIRLRLRSILERLTGIVLGDK